MYLPTSLGTIFSLMVKAKRSERDFWRTTMGKGENDKTVVRLQGQVWLLMTLRDLANGEEGYIPAS